MKIRLLVLVLAVCMIATPAMANLFDFHFGSLTSTYTYSSGTFNVSVNPTLTSGSVTRLEAPIGVMQFLADTPGHSYWGIEGGNFSLSMMINNIGASTADGAGSFTITDTGGDTITGNLAGTWADLGVSNFFAGTLSNVNFISVSDGNFDGHLSSSVLMSFTSLPPWYGTLIELSTTGTWFGDGFDYTTNSGSVDASVVPVPAAVILGILGLGVVGIKLRKYA